MRTLTLFYLLIASTSLYAQVFSNKEVGKKNESLADSLKTAEYPYALPIWGDKATKKGFNLPYSAGLSSQYFWQESLIVIDNLNVGFNNGEKFNLDGIVRFEESKSTASALTVRPDVWLFPFLNVYGILGKAQASTQVNFGVWVPDSTGVESEVVTAATVVEFKTSTFGLGITPTIGVAGGFLALDMNVAWTDVPQLAKPARSFVFGPRLGKNFKLKKERAVAVWMGGFRASITSQTDGSMDLSEVFAGGDAGAKIDQGILKVEGAQQEVDTWWAGLSPLEQNSPVNQAKYERANSMLARAGGILDAADAAFTTITNSTVQYSMQKKLKDAWNFIVGGQYQFNKSFMARVEYGFLGTRNQVIAGVQYRFGL